MREGEQARRSQENARRPKHEQKDDHVGPPMVTEEMMERARTLDREVRGDQELSDTMTRRDRVSEPIVIPDQQHVEAAKEHAEKIAQRGTDNEHEQSQQEVLSTDQPISKGKTASLFSRLKGTWNRFFQKETTTSVETAPEVSAEERAQARELLVQLPERATPDEIRAGLVELVKKLPEILNVLGETSSVMQSLEAEYPDQQYLRTDAIIIQDIMKEESVLERFPAKKEVYEQVRKLSEAVKMLNDRTEMTQRRRQRQMVSPEEIVKGMLENYTMPRRKWDELQRGEQGEETVVPGGEIQFTDEERARVREQMQKDYPEVLEVQERAFRQESLQSSEASEIPNEIRGMSMELPPSGLKISREARNGDLVVKKYDQGELAPQGQLFEKFLERVMEQQPELFADGKPVTNLEELKERLRANRHADVEQKTMGETIQELRQEIATKKDDIQQKKERLAKEYPWWSLSSSARTGRKATQEAIARLEADIRETASFIAELKNIQQMVTPEERAEYKAMYERPVDELIDEIPDENIEPLDLQEVPEENIQPLEEAVPVQVRSGSEVIERNQVTEVRSAEIERIKQEIARLRESIAGKRQRLERDYQWWKLGSRDARKATLAAIEREEENLHDKQWLLADVLNESQLPTRNELAALPQQWVKEPLTRDEINQIEKDKETVRQDLRNKKKSA